MAEHNENLEFDNSNSTKKYDKDWKLELFALIGFCVSGAIFIFSGIKNGDIYTILGSLVWIFSCITWMVPYRKYLDTPKLKELTHNSSYTDK